MDNDLAIIEPHLEDTIPALSFGPFISTPRGLIVDAGHGEIPYELWEAFGLGLQVIGTAYPYVVGDWLGYGETHYGERYVQAVAVTGLAVQTLYNKKFVCDHVPQEIRRPDTLSFAHHAEIASLPVEKQIELLDEAEEQGWTRAELRANVRGDQDPAEVAAELERSFARLLKMTRDMVEYADKPEDVACLLWIVDILEDRGNKDD